MHNLIKISAAGSLALAGVAAHASITQPNSTNVSGDVLLYGAIYNGANIVDGYIGDTAVTVDSVVGGTKPGTFDSTALNTFLADATAGTTVMWSVIGGGAKPSDGSIEFVTTTKTGTFNPNISGSAVSGWVQGLSENIGVINGNVFTTSSQTEANTTNLSQINGIGYNPASAVNDAQNWFGNNEPNFTTSAGGTGSYGATTLYAVTGPASLWGQNGNVTSAKAFTVSLTSAGLTYTAISAVPLPAAVWLLGSGLLGLVGVARRKSAA
jgi:hypothetical protein